jgi:ABC-type antimicrobial peptide transport system permease subunit
MLPGTPSIRVRPALSMFDRSVRAWRLGASMFTAFGVIAVVLAALGVYAVISFLVAQRGHELAIRMALGATGADLGMLVLDETLRVAAGGIGAGLVGSILVARGVRSFLFGISPVAPAVYIAAALGLVAMSLAATWLPVRRAARVDPTTALRAE